MCDDPKYGSSEVIAPFGVPILHRIVVVVIFGGEITPFYFTVVLLLPFEADQLMANTVPAFFWYDKATEYKEPRPLATGLCGRAAFIDEAEVHRQMMTESGKQSQADKFKRAARELGCDEDEAAFERALKQMKPQADKAEKPTKDKG